MFLANALKGYTVYFECGCYGRVFAVIITTPGATVMVEVAAKVMAADPHVFCALRDSLHRGYIAYNNSTMFWMDGGTYVTYDPLADALEDAFGHE